MKKRPGFGILLTSFAVLLVLATPVLCLWQWLVLRGNEFLPWPSTPNDADDLLIMIPFFSALGLVILLALGFAAIVRYHRDN